MQFTWFARCPISAYPRVHVSPGVHDAVKYHDVGLQWILVILRFCLSHGEPETNKHNFWNASNESMEKNIVICYQKLCSIIKPLIFSLWMTECQLRLQEHLTQYFGFQGPVNLIISLFSGLLQLPLHYRYVFKRRNL